MSDKLLEPFGNGSICPWTGEVLSCCGYSAPTSALCWSKLNCSRSLSSLDRGRYLGLTSATRITGHITQSQLGVPTWHSHHSIFLGICWFWKPHCSKPANICTGVIPTPKHIEEFQPQLGGFVVHKRFCCFEESLRWIGSLENKMLVSLQGACFYWNFDVSLGMKWKIWFL